MRFVGYLAEPLAGGHDDKIADYKIEEFFKDHRKRKSE